MNWVVSLKEVSVQESQYKKPAKNLNFGTIDQSAASIWFDSQSKAGVSFFAGNVSCLDLTVSRLLERKYCILI